MYVYSLFSYWFLSYFASIFFPFLFSFVASFSVRASHSLQWFMSPCINLHGHSLTSLAISELSQKPLFTSFFPLSLYISFLCYLLHLFSSFPSRERIKKEKLFDEDNPGRSVPSPSPPPLLPGRTCVKQMRTDAPNRGFRGCSSKTNPRWLHGEARVGRLTQRPGTPHWYLLGLDS